MERLTDADQVMQLTNTLLSNLIDTSNSSPNGGERKDRFIELLSAGKANLQLTYKTYLVLTISIFVIMFLMLILAIIMTISKGGFTSESYMFGGISLTSFFTVLIWKPQSKLLLLSNEINRVSILNATAAALFDTITNIQDDNHRAEVVKSTLNQMFNTLNREPNKSDKSNK